MEHALLVLVVAVAVVLMDMTVVLDKEDNQFLHLLEVFKQQTHYLDLVLVVLVVIMDASVAVEEEVAVAAVLLTN